MEMIPAENNESFITEARNNALNYLRAQLGSDAPAELDEPVVFPWSPLEGEGAAVVFPFTTSRGTTENARFFVVSGRTEPNYYPAHDLTPEEAFELHLGTRFMLVLGVSQVPPQHATADASYDMERDAREIVNRISRAAKIDDLQLAATFQVSDVMHAVLRCTLNGRPVYVMGRDAPLGFSSKVHLAPHVAYRLHIGHVLRREASSDESRS